ncbi:MAG: ketoacyl-ACP synthase III [bacterium]
MQFDYGIGILGTGQYLPGIIETNEQLCKNIPDITPEWIVTKTGITQRYIAEKEETASNMALQASLKAIEEAGIFSNEIGLIIGCTFSHDYQFPPLSAKIQKELKAKDAQVFDIQANCSGFQTGLTVASDRMFLDSSIKYALVIGVELQTRFSNRTNFETAIFLSDGAGAVILGKVDSNYGILNSYFFADTSTYESVRLRGGGSSYPSNGREFNERIDFMEMNGLATWKQAITNLPITIKKILLKTNLSIEDIDIVLFHQANLNLIHYVLKKMKIPIEKTYTNVERIGNTASASLAIVLCEAISKGRIKRNNLVLTATVGAGFIYGASIWRWQ